MRILFVATLATITLAATAVSAEQPYSPKKLSISDVIQPATYEAAPIRLPPEFRMTGTRSVVDGPRLDFEMSYDVDYWALVEYFEDHWKNRKPVSVLDPDVFPHAKNAELLIYGTHSNGASTFFTLGHPDLPYRFRLEIRSDDQSKAIVVVRNAVYSMVYGGVMPARTAFKPAGKADPVRFRWN